MNQDREKYLLALRAAGLSEDLRLSSERAVQALSLYLQEAYGLTRWPEVETRHLHAFLVHLAQHGQQQAASLRQTVSRVRRFFRWLAQTNRVLVNVAADLPLPKAPQTLPHVLSEAQMARLIAQPDTEKAVGLRDRAMLETLYATGIRLGELHRLNLRDFDSRTLRIRKGKGGRERVVPVTATAARWLEQYVATARVELMRGDWWGKGRSHKKRPPSQATALWLAVTGQRLSAPQIDSLIRRYALAADVPASAHTFRHTCATHLLRHGASLRHIQQLLGHQSLDTTVIYTQVELSDLRQAQAQATANLARQSHQS
jgi:integrase/recombinase XerD